MSGSTGRGGLIPASLPKKLEFSKEDEIQTFGASLVVILKMKALRDERTQKQVAQRFCPITNCPAFQLPRAR